MQEFIQIIINWIPKLILKQGFKFHQLIKKLKKHHQKQLLKNNQLARSSKDQEIEQDLVMEVDPVTEQFQKAPIMKQIKPKKTFIIKIFLKKTMNQYKILKYCLFISTIISLKEIKFLFIMINFQEQ